MKRILALVLVLSSVQYARAEAQSDTWQAKMKSLADTMGELLPELYSSNPDPKVVEKGAKTLSELSHDLKMGQKSGKLTPPEDLDPSIKILADQFSAQAKRSYNAIKQGNVEYGTNLLRTVTSYCIACHTRHENGPEFSSFPLSDKVNSLGKQEKAELYVATRQFDKSLSEFKGLIADNNLLKTHPFDWQRSVRNAITVTVRVKKDPAMSAEIVDLALKAPSLPEFERARLMKWKAAINSWKKEPQKKSDTEAGYAGEMRRLAAEATKNQMFPVDRAAEIQYLRTSAAAHDVLRTGKNPKLKAEALMLAGSAYEVLSNPVYWPMHEIFYEGCIRQVPHSSQAQECFSRLEQSIYFGYTGSSGTRIPADVQELLIQLKDLARPKKAQKTQ